MGVVCKASTATLSGSLLPSLHPSRPSFGSLRTIQCQEHLAGEDGAVSVLVVS